MLIEKQKYVYLSALVGYATHIVGKWHLGYNKWEYTPTYRGFDTFYGYYNAQEDHYDHTLLGILDFRDNKEPVTNIGGEFATFKYVEVTYFWQLAVPFKNRIRLNTISFAGK